MSTASNKREHTNRLANESSPYLLQHAHNPVDWYPWGPEAFEAARKQNKPIFLSVGYSTCYWCHVMERQCFEVESIAALMNEKFINIKVDREERPDVDQLYMTAVQVLTQHGGWPMSVFLTPDLKPFYGGTYFPPTDAYGRPGFPTVLRALEDHYRNRREDVEKSANELVDVLNQLAKPTPPRKAVTIDDEAIGRIIARSTGDYDRVHGGFGGAPKFPRETLIELALTYYANPAANQSKIPNLKSKILHSLDAMADGGIRDHLGGGFHRYSTDAKWLVPHFEIMLYDNAMLGWCYVEAHRQAGLPRHASIARGIFDFVLREMTSPDGAFYTAFDAEVDAQEGLSYLWTADEIEAILGPADAKLFNSVYGVDHGPNFADPHHGSGRPDKNILFLPDGPKLEDDPRIVAIRQKLYEARRQRKQPLLDTKILTSWNSLMIRAMAHASQVLNEPRYLHAAATATDFLLENHRMPDGGLYRTSRTSEIIESNGAKVAAFLDDYAFLTQALLALDQAQPGNRWRAAAEDLSKQMVSRFGDHAGGFYFTEANALDLIIRQKTASDSPLPSGNAVAAMVMLDLGEADVARNTLSVFAEQLDLHGESMSAMAQTAMLYLRKRSSFTVEAGAGQADRTRSPDELAQAVVTLGARWIDPRQLIIAMTILRGFHINAQTTEKDLVPTRLFVSADPAVIESIDYPAGEEQRLAFSDTPLRVYSGSAEILVRFVAPVTAPLEMSIQYQPCDDSTCLPQITKRFEVAAP